jgi:hypothetical protein
LPKARFCVPNQLRWALLEDVMDTEKQPHGETITVEKPEEKPAQTITDTVSDLEASSATLIPHSAEAVGDRFKEEATVESPPRKPAKKRKPAKNRKPAPPAPKAKKTKKKTAKTPTQKPRGKTMAKKAKKKTAKAAVKKTAKKMSKKKAKR